MQSAEIARRYLAYFQSRIAITLARPNSASDQEVVSSGRAW
jgi:hypothetical protein